MPALGPWDIVLIVAVSLLVTVMAFVKSPRVKAIFFALPIPSTLGMLSLGHPVGAGHILGLPLGYLFVLGIWLLTRKAQLSIILAIAACAVGYLAVGSALSRVLPESGVAFWISLAAVSSTGLLLFLLLPHRVEPGHRSPMPALLFGHSHGRLPSS